MSSMNGKEHLSTGGSVLNAVVRNRESQQVTFIITAQANNFHFYPSARECILMI